MDVLDKAKRWMIYEGLNMFEFTKSEDMQHWIKEMLDNKEIEVVFSGNKERI